MKKTKIIFDCDPGHDDVIALMVALAHPDEIEILGVTTVAGNNTLDNVTNNILTVLDHLEYTLPVYRGYATPLRREASPAAGHGKTGLDGPNMATAVTQPQSKHALDFLYETLMGSDEKITVVAVGPMTNIGVLLMTYPQVAEKIERVCIMGGGLFTGNVTPKSEFNIWHDPEAAKILFASGLPITMSGLEVCHAGGILHTEYVKLEGKGRASQLVFDLLDFFSQNTKKRGVDWTPIYDMTAIIEILHPDFFASGMYHIDVETEGLLCRGMTVADERPHLTPPEKNTKILLGVDRDKYISVLFKSLERIDARYR